jgi:hypothetical protein
MSTSWRLAFFVLSELLLPRATSPLAILVRDAPATAIAAYAQAKHSPGETCPFTSTACANKQQIQTRSTKRRCSVQRTGHAQYCQV